MPVARSSSSMMIRIEIQIWSQSFILKDSSPLGDRTNYAVKVRHNVTLAV